MAFSFLKDRRTRFWLAMSVLLLVVAGLVLAYFFLPGFAIRGRTVDIEPLRGVVSDNQYDQDLIVPGIWQRIGDRLYGSVSVGDSEVLLPFARFTVTRTRKMSDTLRADQVFAKDVLLYLQAIAEQGRRGDFLTLQRAFETAFLQGDNPVTRIDVEDGAILSVGADDYALWFDYEKALLLAYRRWPEASIERAIERGMAQLKPRLVEDRLGKSMDLPDDITYPWVSTDIQPTPKPPMEGESIVIFSDIDLYVLRALAAFDPDFAAYAATWASEIRNSVPEVGAPFPAYAAWADGDGYIAVQEENLAIETEEVLETVLHVVESGTSIEESLDFFRQRLLDGQGLSTAYRVADGSPVGTAAAADLYALLARIGRAAEDPVLTEAALSELARFYAGSQTSLIFGAFYRDAAEDAFEMHLVDNARALLALR